MHTRCDLSRLDCRPALSRPVYNVAITYVTSIHYVAIEYTEIYIYIYSRIEVRALTRLLQGSGNGAKAVVRAQKSSFQS